MPSATDEQSATGSLSISVKIPSITEIPQTETSIVSDAVAVEEETKSAGLRQSRTTSSTNEKTTSSAKEKAEQTAAVPKKGGIESRPSSKGLSRSSTKRGTATKSAASNKSERALIRRKSSASATTKSSSRPSSPAKSRPNSAQSKASKSRRESTKSQLSQSSSTSSSPSKGTAALNAAFINPVLPTIPSKTKTLTHDEKILIDACRNGEIDVVYEQLWKGTSANCKIPYVGTTPLSIACQNGSRSMASALLEYGAKPKLKDEYKVTPIHWAANHKDPHLMQLLFKKGNLTAADFQVQDEYGSTPLHFASVRNSSEIVSFILAHGGNPLMLNNDSKRPSDVTTDEGIKVKLIVSETKTIEKKMQERGNRGRRPSQVDLTGKKIARISSQDEVNEGLVKTSPNTSEKNIRKRSTLVKKPAAVKTFVSATTR